MGNQQTQEYESEEEIDIYSDKNGPIKYHMEERFQALMEDMPRVCRKMRDE